MLRREARRAALQLLYSLDTGSAWDHFEEQQRLFFGHLAGELAGEARDLAVALCREAVVRRDSLDSLIDASSRNWRIDRMNRVDLAILRLAAAELSGPMATPAPVVLNEAIELAKEFGSPESPGFVNGVLNRLAEDLSGEHGQTGSR